MKKTRSYAVTIGVILLIAALVAWQRDLSGSESVKEAMGILSDCFFVPGVLFTGIGAISWASLTGLYDILGFGGGRAVRMLIPGMGKENYEDFYAYKQMKEKKGRNWKPHFLICGLLSILITITFYLIYLFLA